MTFLLKGVAKSWGIYFTAEWQWINIQQTTFPFFVLRVFFVSIQRFVLETIKKFCLQKIQNIKSLYRSSIPQSIFMHNLPNARSQFSSKITLDHFFSFFYVSLKTIVSSKLLCFSEVTYLVKVNATHQQKVSTFVTQTKKNFVFRIKRKRLSTPLTC